MKLKDVTVYVSAPATVVTTLGAALIAVGLAQILAVEHIPERASDIRTRPATTAPAERQRLPVDRGQIEFLPDGTVHFLLHAVGRRGAQETIRVTDVDGEVLFEGKRTDLPFGYIAWAETIHGGADPVLSRSALLEATGGIGLDFSRCLAVPVVSPDEAGPGIGWISQYWRYLPNRRIFAGFDWTGRRLGYAGANGIRDTQEQVRPFDRFELMTAWCPPDSPSPVLLWLTGTRLYQINFAHASVQTLFETGDKEVGFITAGNWDGLNPSGNTAPPIVCLATTDGTCRILWNQPQRRVELQLPDDSRGLGSAIGTAEGKLFLRVSRPEGGWGPPSEALLQRWQEKYRLRPYKEWMELYEISPAGQTDLISRYEWTRPAWSMRRMGDRVRSAVTVASSPLFSLAWRWHYRDVWASWWHWHYPDVWLRQGRETAAVTVGIAEWLREMRPTHPVTNLAVSALGVAIACWHAWARRTSWSKFAFWMALVAGFSLAGLLTYLALNHTPTIRCPGCGRKRSLRRPSCPACHALLPAPRPRDVDLILPAGCERPVGEGRQGAV